MGETSAVPAIQIGDTVLERYRVVEQIGSGGHSVVYRGTDARLSRPVCIKVFSGLGGQSGVGRTSYEHFVQEAFALSRLTHPNTLRIYDFGHLGSKDAGGMPLQVCEFMNGGTLSNVVREQGKQTIGETGRVIGAMCAALAEAHALGIVHRDIKPQNILFGTVGSDRLPKLADFGIAKWSVDDEVQEDKGRRAEDTAIVAGQKLAMYSPSWAAPEQLAGQPVSAATDIYSLAAVAVYMLSGKAIFADEDVYAGYKKRRHADELVTSALRPLYIKQPVIDLLVRALAFDPKRRLARVEELDLAAAAEPGFEALATAEIPRMAAARAITDSGVKLLEIEPITPPTTTDALTPVPTPVTPLRAIPAIDPPVVAPAVAPTPPVVPTPPVLGAFQTGLPQVRQPWMAVAPAANGAAARIPLTDHPIAVGDRRVHVVMVQHDIVDLVGPQNTKLRITFLVSAHGGRMLHVKGMTCFVAHLGGRPSPALQLEQPGDLALVTPRAQEVGHVRVLTGEASLGTTVFALGAGYVALSQEDCIDPILFDFGPGSDAYFLYTRGRALPKPRR